MDLRQSDLGLLLALDALLAELNVTRAAERLNISQPAMSAQLARLRDLFGDPLLVLTGRKLVPTPRAMALKEPLKRTLEELSGLVVERETFDPATSKRTFRILAPDYLHAVATLPLIQAAEVMAPNIKFALLQFDPATAWPMLENLEADLLVAWKEVTPQDARARRLYKDRLCLVQRKGHPRGRKKLTLDAFCKLQHVTISPEGGALRGPVDDVLEKLGRKRNVVASVPTFLAAPMLVAQSDLVTAMPQRLAEKILDQLEIYDLPLPALTYDIIASWHARMQNDAGHKWLRDLLVAPFLQT